MQWTDLDLANGIWRIQPRDRKIDARRKNKRTEPPHLVPLPGMTMAILQRRHATRDSKSVYVFSRPGQPDASIFARAKKAAEFYETRTRFRFAAHWLRHTVTTDMAAAGVSEWDRALVLNHTSVTKASVTTEVYDHWAYLAEKRSALDRWEARVRRILAGEDPSEVQPHSTSALSSGPTEALAEQVAAALARRWAANVTPPAFTTEQFEKMVDTEIAARRSAAAREPKK